MDWTRIPTGQPKPDSGCPDRLPADSPGGRVDVDRESVIDAATPPSAQDRWATTVLHDLTVNGVLDRVAARAALLIADGRLDARDLKQLLSPLTRSRPARSAGTASGEAAGQELAAGEALGRYEVSGLLGRGATARVYRAVHPTLRVQVALKVPHLSDAASTRRLRAEAAVLARVCHPNVVRLWDVEHADDRPILVLECVDGESFAQILRRHGRVPPRRAYRAVLAAARGLRAAHRRGVVHGDVKPGNLLAARDGAVKLIDFGSAHRQAVAGDGGVVEGSWAYRAPEGFGGPTDGRSDIYSLGLTLHHLLTGTAAVAGDFDDCLEQHRRLDLEPAHWAVPGVGPAVSALIQRMTARHPADRFPDCDALLAAARPAFAPRGTDR